MFVSGAAPAGARVSSGDGARIGSSYVRGICLRASAAAAAAAGAAAATAWRGSASAEMQTWLGIRANLAEPASSIYSGMSAHGHERCKDKGATESSLQAGIGSS